MSCQFPSFDELGFEQKSLLAHLQGLNPALKGPSLYSSGLSDKQKACFLNVTAALDWVGIRTLGLRLLPVVAGSKTSGIQEDRLCFALAGSERLRAQLEDRIANKTRFGDKGFVSDKPLSSEHPGMDEWGGRQWVTTTALQIGGGRDGAFVDIDEFGLKTDVVGAVGHAGEVLKNAPLKLFGLKLKKGRLTDPFKIAKGLRRRGIDVRFACP